MASLIATPVTGVGRRAEERGDPWVPALAVELLETLGRAQVVRIAGLALHPRQVVLRPGWHGEEQPAGDAVDDRPDAQADVGPRLGLERGSDRRAADEERVLGAHSGRWFVAVGERQCRRGVDGQ